MATVATPTLNLYYTRDPVQYAQERYSQQTRNDRYAYITLIAFAALTAVANMYLYSTAFPLALVPLNIAALSIAYQWVYPCAMDCFAAARKCQEKGDKETLIAANLHMLRAMGDQALTEEFEKRDIPVPRPPPPQTLQQVPELLLLARLIRREKFAEIFKAAADRLSAENEVGESLEAKIAGRKEKLKAGFLAYLISHENHQGKFKDSFAWIDMPIEQRIAQLDNKIAAAKNIVRTRGPSPRRLKWDEVQGTAGVIGELIHDQLKS